jgi:hypothetical protein
MNTVGDLVSITTMSFTTISSAVAVSSSVIVGIVVIFARAVFVIIAAVAGGVTGVFVDDVVPPFRGRG